MKYIKQLLQDSEKKAKAGRLGKKVNFKEVTHVKVSFLFNVFPISPPSISQSIRPQQNCNRKHEQQKEILIFSFFPLIALS